MKYKVTYNRSRKTYTIREYDEKGKKITKFRSYPQGKYYNEELTENDIRSLFKYNELYEIK